MKNIFILNPTAGKNIFQKKAEQSVKDYFGLSDNYEIIYTKAKGHATKIAKKCAKTNDTVNVFACGGEGTVLEVLNGIIGHDNVNLGVIPCGSANDFLKFFGYENKQKFFDIGAQTNGQIVRMDVIKAGDTYCLNGASVGMDAMVARDMNIFKKWPLVTGPIAYKLAIVKNLVKRLGVKIKVSVDGENPVEADCLFAALSNAPYYGGGYMSAPKAVPYDRILDFTLVDTISKLKVPSFLSLYEKGEHATLPFCHLKRCGSMEFWSDKPIPVNLDGEIIETTNMLFSIVKDAVNFILPAGIKLP
ncbi:MAG: diacylglycerol kinase family lipid kinase [Clostridia bacterium]|nr:diacylglycerol kinase family lipid kinase [Clostridia bacterium]